MRSTPGIPAFHEATATSPPLGGTSEYFHGRSSDSAGSDLLAGLPKSIDSVSSSAFVPAYRCGAVPEFHRIPFSFPENTPGNHGITSLYPCFSNAATTYCGYLAGNTDL